MSEENKELAPVTEEKLEVSDEIQFLYDKLVLMKREKEDLLHRVDVITLAEKQVSLMLDKIVSKEE